MDAEKILSHPEVSKVLNAAEEQLSESERSLLIASVHKALGHVTTIVTTTDGLGQRMPINESVQTAHEMQLATGVVLGSLATIKESRGGVDV